MKSITSTFRLLCAMTTAMFIVLAFSFCSLAQSPAIEWQKSLGGSSEETVYPNCIQQTVDGGYIVAVTANSTDGDVTGNHGSHDYWIVKLNDIGAIQWQKSLGGSSEEYAYSIQQTVDGGYIVSGLTLSKDGDVTAHYGGYDYWIVKLNSSGDIQWQKSLGGSMDEYAYSIQQTVDGGYIVGGWSCSTDGDVTGNHGDYDYWIVKLNDTGTIQWQKSLGGTGYDRANSIQQTTDGGYIVAGQSNSSNGDVTGNHGTFDIWIVKLNDTGTIQWQKSLGGTGYDYANSIRQTADGGYIVAGMSNSTNGDVTGNHGSWDFWVVKLNDNGTIQWQKSFGGSDNDGANSIQQTVDGGYIVGGHTKSADGDVTGYHGSYDTWIVKLNSSGTIQWQKALGGTEWDYANSIQQTTDGGYIIASLSRSTDGDVTGNHGDFDCWIVKLEGSQKTIATGAVSGSPFCAGSSISVPYTVSAPFNAGNVFTAQLSDAAGSFSSPVNIGTLSATGNGTINATIPGSTPSGSGYRIRVIGSNPVVTGSDNNSNLAINPLGGSASPNYSIICPTTTQTLTTDGSGGDLQWQTSVNNITWSDVSGATNSSYTTPDGATLGGAGTKVYYRCLVKNTNCFNVSSTTAIVDVSQPTITVTVSAKTDQSLTLDWSPVGSGNYDITYDGASAGSVSGKTPPYTLSGLNSGGSYNITVTQTRVVGCSASGTLTGVNTLCAMPDNVAVSSPGNRKLKVDWEGAAGNYRVYYRPTFIQNGYQSKDVTTTGTSGSTTINVTYNTSYEVYVASKDCPSSGQYGQASALYYGIVGPSSSCTPSPTIHYVKSTCAGQIEVSMSGSPTGKYRIAVQRLTPTVASMYLYNVTGSYFQVNVNSPGQTFLVAVASRCLTGISDYTVFSGGITIKPLCNAIPNLVLSHPTCYGFTASWNRDECSENTVNTYQIFLRRTSPRPQLTWNSYVVASPSPPITPYKLVNWMDRGSVIQCYVRSNYVCSGYIIQGPSSTTESITTLSIGCREEEELLIQPEEPAAVMTSADNTEAISLYPNPNGGQFRIDISRLSNEKAEVRIEVMNILGQTILTRISEAKDGFGNEIITLPETASSGTYFVRVTVDSNIYVEKVSLNK